MSGRNEEPQLDLAVTLSLLGAATDAYVLEGLRRRRLTGVTAGHGYVIQRLVTGPATVGEMAEVLGVTQQAVSKTVRELARLGYTRQTEDPADRRRRPVELTPRGRRVVDAGRELRAELERRVEREVGAERLAAAREVLTATIRALGIEAGIRGRAVPPPPERS
jgi:DNA-binding MarR family transcriptional regulator